MKVKESNKPIDILERYANKKTSLGWVHDDIPDIVGFKYQFHKLFPIPCDCVIGFEGDIPVTHKLCDNCKSKIWE